MLGEWEKHPENKTVKWVQAISEEEQEVATSSSYSKPLDTSDYSEDEEETKQTGNEESDEEEQDELSDEEPPKQASQQNKFASLQME